VALVAGSATRSAASSPSSQAPAAERDCFHELVHGKGPEIVCTFQVRMTDEELAGVRKATRDLLQDARCSMTVRIERRLIDEALGAADHVFQAPAQPVACDVTTSKSSIPITFTFAPRVEFKNGVAVKASPGMDGVTGVSRILSWPVVAYVNHSREIRDGMLQVVNAYMQRYGQKPARAAGR
jgi:hypothetical protein